MQLTDLLENTSKFYSLDFSRGWNVRSHPLFKMFSALINFSFSQSCDADVLLFVGLFCYVPNIQRSFFYWACLFLFLIAITKPDVLEWNKVKDKRCDQVSKLWKSIIICFEIVIFVNSWRMVKISNVLEKKEKITNLFKEAPRQYIIILSLIHRIWLNIFLIPGG